VKDAMVVTGVVTVQEWAKDKWCTVIRRAANVLARSCEEEDLFRNVMTFSKTQFGTLEQRNVCGKCNYKQINV
jgi:hypothetical protein